MRIFIALVLVGIVAAGGWYWNSSSTGDVAAAGAAPAARPGMPVEAYVTEAGSVSRTAIALGTIRSSESVIINSEISGRITRIGFEEGQAVAAGALLFQLDDSVLRAERDQAAANLKLATRNQERAQSLHRQKLASDRERDEAAASLELAQASLQLSEAKLAKTRLTAPFSGVAGLRSVSPGDYVQPGTVLVNVEAIDNLKVDFRVAEKALPALSVGMQLTLEVDAWPGEVFNGEVYAIDPKLEIGNRSIGLRARLENPGHKLRPGLFAKVTVAYDQRDDAILVPEQAIMPRGEQSFVYVIEDGKAAIRPVELGYRSKGTVEVTKGVTAGETVITAGWQKIGPGSAVSAINLSDGTDAGGK